MDKVRDEGQAIVGDLLQKQPAERNYRLLSKVELEKIFAHVTGEWYPAHITHGRLLDALEPLLLMF